MKFKPVTDTYKFEENELTSFYPEYIQGPIMSWIKSMLIREGLLGLPGSVGGGYINISFVNKVNIILRRTFPKTFNNFIEFIFSNNDLTTNFIGLCLQNYATISDSVNLEEILSVGGSSYAVIITNKRAGNSDKGIADLAVRVPSLVVEASQSVLNNEQLIREAWNCCYSRNPDYEKTVSKCCDAMEKIWGEKYFSKDPKPQIKKFVKNFSSNPSQLSYKGNSIISPKNLLTDLAEKFSDIRGQHTAGNGRLPTKEEAEMVLHYTIFIWHLDK